MHARHAVRADQRGQACGLPPVRWTGSPQRPRPASATNTGPSLASPDPAQGDAGAGRVAATASPLRRYAPRRLALGSAWVPALHRAQGVAPWASVGPGWLGVAAERCRGDAPFPLPSPAMTSLCVAPRGLLTLPAPGERGPARQDPRDKDAWAVPPPTHLARSRLQFNVRMLLQWKVSCIPCCTPRNFFLRL